MAAPLWADAVFVRLIRFGHSILFFVQCSWAGEALEVACFLGCGFRHQTLGFILFNVIDHLNHVF